MYFCTVNGNSSVKIFTLNSAHALAAGFKAFRPAACYITSIPVSLCQRHIRMQNINVPTVLSLSKLKALIIILILACFDLCVCRLNVCVP